jgi:hypothetical protein
MLGREGLMDWLRFAPKHSPAAAGHFVLKRLAEFRGGSVVDDETIIAIQREV